MESFAATPDGWLLCANGIDPVLRWNGMTDQMEPAGVQPATSAPTMTFSGSDADGMTGDYYAFVRFVDAYGNVSDLSPLVGPVTANGATKVTYTGVAIPVEAKAARRQILRNSAGQTQVFYVDVDTDDLTSDSFSSTNLDSILQVQESVAVVDEQGNDLANRHAIPPADKAVLAAHLGRMFAAVEEIYTEGCVEVTLGSLTVQGVGTAWPATLAGRYLWVAGAERSYEIQSVDPVAQTITLLDPYESPTNKFATYAIRPPVGSRRLVQFSEAGLPESWPASNAIEVQENGDEFTGLMPMESYLYVLERRHIHRTTYQADPTTDGYVYQACGRGCVNNRCWVVVNGAAYLLDEAGVYVFDGDQPSPLSGAIQDLFEPPARNRRYRINFQAARHFHACFDPGTHVARWFVSLTGTRYPRHALCFNLLTQAWWAEEYPFFVGGSCTGVLGGERRVFLGGPGGKVYLLGQGTLDMVDPVRGSVRGTVTDRTPLSLTDANADFGDDTLGAPVVLVDGRGRGQWRTIVAASNGRLTIDVPWTRLPAVGDTYQVGGIRWRYRTGWFRWLPSEADSPRRLEILYEPCDAPQTLDAALYMDRSKDPQTWDADYRPRELSGMGSVRGGDALTGDLTGTLGFMQRRLDGHKDFYIDGGRIFAWEFSGITNEDRATFYEMTIDGASGGGQGGE